MRLEVRWEHALFLNLSGVAVYSGLLFHWIREVSGKAGRFPSFTTPWRRQCGSCERCSP